MSRRPRPRRRTSGPPVETAGGAVSLGARGDAVVHLDTGGAVHVSGLLPGERARVETSGERGRVLERLSDAPERTEPECPVAERCGGCAVQHFADRPYLDWKRALVSEALAREGVEADVAPIEPAWGEGRRRITLHARRIGRRVISGFSERASDRLVEIEDCPVAAGPLRRRLPGLRELADRLAPKKGTLNLSATALENGIDVALSGARPLTLEDRERIAAMAVEQGFVRVTVDGDPVIERARPIVRFGDVEATPPPGGFLQATAAGEAALAGRVLAGLNEARRAADLYCGSGAFALRLARRTPVLAAEADEASLGALSHAAARTPGLKPVETRLRNLVQEPISAGELDGIDAAVVDPPRAGAQAQMHQLVSSRVERIASISCNPRTFARDAAILIAGGFRIGKVTPVDQFRWTGHIEVFALFVR